MRPPDDNTDADARPSSHDEPDLGHTARAELDLGLTGRVLDWANTLTWGITAGAGMGTWVTLCLGMTTAFGSDAVASDRITYSGFFGFLLTAAAFFVIASAVSAARTLWYAKRVGDAMREPDASPVADYQAWTAVGSTRFGEAFVGWYALAIVIISVGAIMTIAAVSFLAEGESGSSTLIALAIAVGSVAVGIALIMVIKRMRSLRTRLCPDDPRGKRPPHPPGTRRVPSPASRSHRQVTRTQTVVLNSAFVILFGGIVAFVAWGILTGQAVMIGGHVRAVPETLRSDLSPAELTAKEVIAMILAATAIVTMLLILVVIILGGVRRAIALRSLIPSATSPDVDRTHPRKDVSEDALTSYSGARRATGVVGAITAGLFVAGASSLATVIPAMTPGVLIGIGVLAVVASGVIDIVTEPRSRQTRNLLFAAWPSAQAFTSRFPPKKEKGTKKSPRTQKSED